MGRKRCADKRMEQIYKVIKEQLMKKGYPPSVREIGKEVGLKSSLHRFQHLHRVS